MSGQEIELLVLDEKLFNLLRADLYLCQELDETDFAINLMKFSIYLFALNLEDEDRQNCRR